MRRLTLVTAVLALAASALPAEARQCATMGATQHAGAVRYCVDSVLASQSGNDYGPRNLFDGNPRTAWCEGAGGTGAGQRIVLTISDGIPFDRLFIWNGYQKSAASFARNARPRIVSISTDGGPAVRYTLPDAMGRTQLRLNRTARGESVVITIRDVYPGTRYADMCISGIYPDFAAAPAKPKPPQPKPPQPPSGGGTAPAGGLHDIAPLPDLPGL